MTDSDRHYSALPSWALESPAEIGPQGQAAAADPDPDIARPGAAADRPPGDSDSECHSVRVPVGDKVRVGRDSWLRVVSLLAVAVAN